MYNKMVEKVTGTILVLQLAPDYELVQVPTAELVPKERRRGGEA
jgi:hypothetical protein